MVGAIFVFINFQTVVQSISCKRRSAITNIVEYAQNLTQSLILSVEAELHLHCSAVGNILNSTHSVVSNRQRRVQYSRTRVLLYRVYLYYTHVTVLAFKLQQSLFEMYWYITCTPVLSTYEYLWTLF